MAAAVNDVVKVVVNQVQAGQVIQNVFWYRVVALTGLTGDYLTVVKDWIQNEVIETYRGLQSVMLTYTSMYLINVTNGVDFLDFPFNPTFTGLANGDALPPNVSWTIRLIRETLVTRNGYKRLAGVPEALQNNGTSTVPSSDWTPILEAVAADIQPAPSVIPLLEPVIVRRGPTGTVLAVNSIGSADFRGIGTQNTRKIGRGV